MADRDFKAFITFLSPDAVFFSGSCRQTRARRGGGRSGNRYFRRPQSAIFLGTRSCRSAGLGRARTEHRAGVRGPQDRPVAFNSIWRLESDNVWRIVFDKGEAVCNTKP